MNRYLPCLIAALLSLALSARAAESNRVADGGSEPGSSWVKVKFVDGSNLAHEYWCHASDCDFMRFQGASKKVNRVSHVAYLAAVGPYMENVPIYSLWPVKDPMISLPTFKAVKAPMAIKELDYSEDTRLPDRAFFDFDGPDGKREIGTFDMNARLAQGNIVVLAQEGAETGKPMELGTTELGAACTPDAYDGYYGAGAGEKRLLDKAFEPMEFQLERANLGINFVVARVHSGTLNGRDFASIAREANSGNLRIADDFVGAMRPAIRTAAKLYGMSSTSYPADKLDPFEQRFLVCLMGFAGKQKEFMTRVFEAQSNPAAFTASWRKFLQTLTGRYADSTPPPQFADKDAFDQLDWRREWDGLNAVAVSWLETGAFPAPPAPPAAVTTAPPQPQIVRKRVEPPPAPRKAPVQHVAPQNVDDTLDKAFGEK